MTLLGVSRLPQTAFFRHFHSKNLNDFPISLGSSCHDIPPIHLLLALCEKCTWNLWRNRLRQSPSQPNHWTSYFCGVAASRIGQCFTWPTSPQWNCSIYFHLCHSFPSFVWRRRTSSDGYHHPINYIQFIDFRYLGWVSNSLSLENWTKSSSKNREQCTLTSSIYPFLF